eukprot:7471877-Lingulodinium_polyedra.AAC.1
MVGCFAASMAGRQACADAIQAPWSGRRAASPKLPKTRTGYGMDGTATTLCRRMLSFLRRDAVRVR